MKKQHLFLFLLLIALPMFSFVKKETIPFLKAEYAAKELAKKDGKLYFIDFTAAWCMPCRLMDETTYQDPTLTEYINDNFVAVKVDIDDFDGYALKDKYGVKLLPTIIVFNSKGKQVARIEESLSASRMLNELKKYNTYENKVRSTNSPSTVSIKPSTVTPSPAKPNTKTPSPIVRVPLPPTTTTKPKVTPTTPTAPAKNVGVLSKLSEGLYDASFKKKAIRMFTLQTATFGQEVSVKAEMARLQQRTDKPVMVYVDKANGKSTFRVLVGDFKTREESVRFQKVLKNIGIDSVIKEISKL